MSDQAQGPGWWRASDGKWYPPESHPDYRTEPPRTVPHFAPSTLPPPAARPGWSPAQIVAVVGAAATVVGCFMPWAKVAFFTVDGTDAGDFPFFIAAGGLLLLAALIRNSPGVLLMSFVLGGLWLYEMVNIRDGTEDADINITIGVGLWVIGLGAVAAFVSALVSLSQKQGIP